jgi:hypothetical protein
LLKKFLQNIEGMLGGEEEEETLNEEVDREVADYAHKKAAKFCNLTADSNKTRPTDKKKGKPTIKPTAKKPAQSKSKKKVESEETDSESSTYESESESDEEKGEEDTDTGVTMLQKGRRDDVQEEPKLQVQLRRRQPQSKQAALDSDLKHKREKRRAEESTSSEEDESFEDSSDSSDESDYEDYEEDTRKKQSNRLSKPRQQVQDRPKPIPPAASKERGEVTKEKEENPTKLEKAVAETKRSPKLSPPSAGAKTGRAPRVQATATSSKTRTGATKATPTTKQTTAGPTRIEKPGVSSRRNSPSMPLAKAKTEGRTASKPTPPATKAKATSARAPAVPSSQKRIPRRPQLVAPTPVQAEIEKAKEVQLFLFPTNYTGN